MKKWAFVSDFDGTISEEDYYWMVINKYFSKGKDLFNDWKAGEIKDIDFLAAVFKEIHQEEAAIINDIHTLPIDEYVPEFVKQVQKNGGDFYILSAGTDYYIHHILDKYKIENVTVFSNEGYFHEKNIHLRIDKNAWKYSERYGIDKSKVIQKLKTEYEEVYFAGDSEPDSHPAIYADLTFAKSALQGMLAEKGVSFLPVDQFSEIEDYLVKKGLISR